MKGENGSDCMSASLWNIPNWFNWYWWGLDDLEKEDPNEISELKEPIIENTELKPEIKSISKRKVNRKNKILKKDEMIKLFLKPKILEKLEKEAQETDSTLNKLIQIILESHIESKENSIEQANNSTNETESWKCTFCTPEEEFPDYFKFSEHFFSQHMQPGLEKLSNTNQEYKKSES